MCLAEVAGVLERQKLVAAYHAEGPVADPEEEAELMLVAHRLDSR